MYHRQIIGTEGFQQALHAGDDFIVNLVAGKGVAGTGPGIGQIDADQCRLLAETDPALKAVVLVQGGGFVEGLVQHAHQIF